MKGLFAILLLSTAALASVRAEEPSAAAAAEQVALTISPEQEPVRPAASAYMLEIGGARMADTYLSPITYRGWSLGLGYERFQAMKFDPERWSMMLNFHADIDRGKNRVGNAETWRINGIAEWGMFRRWSTPIDRLTLALGGSASLDIGCLYNARNSNNPASAKCALTLNLTGYAAYRLNLGRLPVNLRWQPTLPLLGAFFSPQYDELYYEIYLGNDSGLSHFAWPGNRFAMVNFVSVDLQFGTTCLRLGFRSTVMSSKVCNLVTNVSTNAFVIGISGEWISLSSLKKADKSTRVINAIY